ncbi:MAG TPA: hypothetical protein PLI73_04410, partial [Candidatus Cloacimonadota bacterium]|nr:hypothetical protein [Candidatus Cloacimonadota bacterium]
SLGFRSVQAFADFGERNWRSLTLYSIEARPDQWQLKKRLDQINGGMPIDALLDKICRVSMLALWSKRSNPWILWPLR